MHKVLWNTRTDHSDTVPPLSGPAPSGAVVPCPKTPFAARAGGEHRWCGERIARACGTESAASTPDERRIEESIGECAARRADAREVGGVAPERPDPARSGGGRRAALGAPPDPGRSTS